MENMSNKNPSYLQSPIMEFQGNPLVEALLPPAASLLEAIERLAKKPEYDESELDLPRHYRALLPSRLLNCMFPTPQHIKLQARISDQILNGYRWRNPFENRQVGDLRPQRCPPVSMLTGHSGMGTSSLIRAIMRSMGKPVIAHSNYKGIPFSETQILYIIQSVPSHYGVKAMLKSFGDYTDQLLGHNVYSDLFAGKTMSTMEYVTALRKVVASHHVGALVFDELRNLTLASRRGKNEFFGLIRDLHAELGIPIILVGSYSAASILRQVSVTCPRIDGFHQLKKPESYEDDDWCCLCDAIWRYQWVRKPQALTAEVVELLYKYSQGITGNVLNLFVRAQSLALERGLETVTPALITMVKEERNRQV